MDFDILLCAGILQGGDHHLTRLVDVVRIGPVWERPIVANETPFITQHADAVFKTGHHVFGEATLFEKDQYFIRLRRWADPRFVGLLTQIHQVHNILRMQSLMLRGQREQVTMGVIVQRKPEGGMQVHYQRLTCMNFRSQPGVQGLPINLVT